MINIIKKEIDVEESLRKRLEIYVIFVIINGSIIRIDKEYLYDKRLLKKLVPNKK